MTFFIERRIFGDFKFRRCLKEEKSEGSVEREGECGNVVDLACDSAYTPRACVHVYTRNYYFCSRLCEHCITFQGYASSLRLSRACPWLSIETTCQSIRAAAVCEMERREWNLFFRRRIPGRNCQQFSCRIHKLLADLAEINTETFDI